MESNPLLFLDAEQVEQNLPLKELVDGIETSFVHYSTKLEGVSQPDRMVLPVGQDGNFFLVKPAVSIPDKTISTKLLTYYPENESKFNIPVINAVIAVFDSESGQMQGVLDGISVTDLRTAAASAVAVKHLSKDSHNVLAIIGTGHQGASHVKVLREIREFKEIRVYSRSKEKTDKFAQTWNVTGCSSIEEAVKGADIIVTATNSDLPILFHDWIKVGSLVVSVGACLSHLREIDDETMKSSQIVVDTRDVSYKNAGDIVGSKVKIDGELGDVINGTVEIKWDKTRVFKSNGMALQDLVASRIVIDNVLKKKHKR